MTVITYNGEGRKEKVRSSLRQHVYNLIKHDIISCSLPPGEQIVESQLAELYQTSKTPVREALTSLQQENLVEYRAHKGFTVSTITLKDVQEIYEARLFFETTLMRLAIKHITDEEVDHIEKFQEYTCNLNDPVSIDNYIQANHDFHMAIACATRNSRLCWHFEILMNDASRLTYMDVKYNNVLHTWYQSHQRFIDALRTRDEEAGVAAIEEVMENAKKRILGG